MNPRDRGHQKRFKELVRFKERRKFRNRVRCVSPGTGDGRCIVHELFIYVLLTYIETELEILGSVIFCRKFDYSKCYQKKEDIYCQ